VQETAEQIASVDPGRLIVADDSQSRTRRWALRRQRLVRAMGVGVRDVGPKGLLEVAAADDQQPVQALGADGAHPALRIGIGLGRVGCQKSIVAVTSSNRLMTGYDPPSLLALVGGGLCGLVVRLPGAAAQR
jgi:hypothetical protein